MEVHLRYQIGHMLGWGIPVVAGSPIRMVSLRIKQQNNKTYKVQGRQENHQSMDLRVESRENYHERRIDSF